MHVLEAKAARGELTERQVVKLASLRAAMRPPIVNEAIAAALQYERETAPRRSKRLAAKPRVSYEGMDAEEAEAEVVEPRRSARLAAKPRVFYADPSVGQLRYEAAVAAMLALRNGNM